MVALKIIAIAIGLIIAGIVGLTEIFTYSGQKSPLSQLLSPTSENITIPSINENITIPKPNEPFDFQKWISEIPVNDIIDMVIKGASGFINWASRGVAGFITTIVRLVYPDITFPDWFGLIVVVFVGGMIIMKSIEGVANLSFSIWQYGMVALVAAIIIAIVFIYLGIL